MMVRVLTAYLLAAAGALSLSTPSPCGPASAVCCDPNSTPQQVCPGGAVCEPCGGNNCECPPSPPVPTGSFSDTRLTIVNGCKKGPMWIAHIIGGGVGPDPQDVKIQPGESARFHTGLNGGGLSATRFWPKMGCNAHGSNCTVGSSGGPGEGCVVHVAGKGDDYSHCAPPVDTKFEATFSTPGSTILDTVDTSLVDGYTLPFKLEVAGGSCSRHLKPFTGMDCTGLSLAKCPTAEVLNNEKKSLLAVQPTTGAQGGCYSPCMRLTDDKWTPKGQAVAPDSAAAGQYCCAGAFGNPGTCNAGDILQTSYIKATREACGASYDYAYDDKTATITCSVSTAYTLTFYCMQDA